MSKPVHHISIVKGGPLDFKFRLYPTQNFLLLEFEFLFRGSIPLLWANLHYTLSLEFRCRRFVQIVQIPLRSVSLLTSDMLASDFTARLSSFSFLECSYPIISIAEPLLDAAWGHTCFLFLSFFFSLCTCVEFRGSAVSKVSPHGNIKFTHRGDKYQRSSFQI